MKFILAKKLGMTTIYVDGIAHNVTLLEVGRNKITQLRIQEKDGYSAVQIGYEKENVDEKVANRYENFSEFRADSLEGMNVGDELTVEGFEVNDKVDVRGISKGKGFQGGMKRHNFSGSPATHGHRHDHRAPGSIGCAFPERVFKGKRMAGRMGSDNCTVKNLKISLVNKEKSLLAVKGSVPGNNGIIVRVIKK